MTTPQTPAGWYADPDGSGGQRYWDGHSWTEHRAPAPLPPPPAAPPVVTRERVGSHRAPDPDGEPEPASPADQSEATTVTPTTPPPSGRTAVIPTVPPPAEPQDAGRTLVMRYLVAVAALLAVLLALVIYAAFFTGDGSTRIAVPETSSSAAPTTGESTTSGDTETVAPPDTGEVTDGTLAFTVHGIEIAPSIAAADVPVRKTAQGEYVIVHMTVRNIGDAPATFLGTFQKLAAAGTNYPIDDEATFYAGGGIAQLAPGDEADVAVAFDVPPGTSPDAIELHADPLSPGIEVPLT